MPPEPVRGAYVTAGDRAALETAARDFSFLPRQPVHSLLGQAAQQRRGTDWENDALTFPSGSG